MRSPCDCPTSDGAPKLELRATPTGSAGCVGSSGVSPSDTVLSLAISDGVERGSGGWRIEAWDGTSTESFWKQHQSFGSRRGVKTAIPGRQDQVLVGEHERGGKIELVEATQLAIDRECRSVFDKILVDLHDTE